MAFARNAGLNIIGVLVFIFLAIQVFFILFDWSAALVKPPASVLHTVNNLRSRLNGYHLLYIPGSVIGKIGVCLLVIIFFKTGRNLLFFLLRQAGTIIRMLPGAGTKDLLKRYINLGRFAFFNHQARIFGRLRDQYPPGTAFVILPMDMEYMGAGKLKPQFRYAQQMEMLARMKKKEVYKDIFYPFVFVDPRRITDDPEFFKYEWKDGKIILGKCFIKEFIEINGFSGFKIYPALGYYPFDERLLPLWLYAVQNDLPITTHCIRGTIFYRGGKLREWDSHPVFRTIGPNNQPQPLPLLESMNKDYMNNFTHPLNYLCLLEEKLLRQLVGKAKDDKIKNIFGYTDGSTPLQRDLRDLKICFGHFGGDDEWDRFFEKDRDNYSSQLATNPDRGMLFLTDEYGNPTPYKPSQAWYSADWYTIVCSILLQYHNTYADISYILHDTSIIPLLKQTLQNPSLSDKVLFGTDFYVVRNHKSEKNMLADMIDHLPEKMFDKIARENPVSFLKNKIQL